ncbi:MAG: CPBP family intramembrane metalloprotease [Planctomycetota bacterium]|nr:MAG: CPBP family intramembrane metalloprotease [Planctomycetota bacterium]
MVGAGLWLGICLSPVGEFAREAAARLGGRSALRPGYDPFTELQLFGNAAIYTYLAVRMWGLILLIPLIEEAFLRGFLMRLVIDGDWQRVPFGMLTRGAYAAMLAYAVCTHPAEVPAAIAWFSLVAYTAHRTRSFGDCVAAHVITNAALAGYALTTGDWSLL